MPLVQSWVYRLLPGLHRQNEWLRIATETAGHSSRGGLTVVPVIF
jgi:hypothetical protein